MSWDSYIDNLIDRTGIDPSCDQACIIGLDGSIWTTNAHAKSIKIKPTEATAIAKMMDTGDFSSAQAGGIMLAGVKYQFLRGEDDIALGKKKDHGAVTIQKSKKAVVIGHTAEGKQQGDTNSGVTCIVNYLEGLGF